ncbi:MAG: protein kinase domain-containing protein [Planctomycetota bacterium]
MERKILDEFIEYLNSTGNPSVESFLRSRADVSEPDRKELKDYYEYLFHHSAAGGQQPALPPSVPPWIGGFRILSVLGGGGMGIVYLAEQISLKRKVALKVIRPESAASRESTALFEREAGILASLANKNIVKAIASGEENGIHYLAMELVQGRTLAEALLEKKDFLDVPGFLQLFAQLARALAVVHEAGIVHRDIKPSNIKIGADGEPIIIDFGLARGDDFASLTWTGEFRGTPYYAAPEQVSARHGGIDARTDIYALGASLYQCLTGRVPHESKTTEQLFHEILTKDPVSPRAVNRDLSRDVETVVMTAMAKEPERRYQNARALAEDLEALLTLKPIRARPPGTAARIYLWTRRNRALAASIALSTTAAIAVAGIFTFQFINKERAFRTEIGSARALLASGNIKESIEAFDRALAQKSGDPDAALGKAEAEKIQNKLAAEKEIQTSRELLVRAAALRKRIAVAEPIVRTLEVALYSRFITDGERKQYIDARDEWTGARAEYQKNIALAMGSLSRAAALNAEKAALDSAFCEYYLEELYEARRAENPDLRERAAQSLKLYDKDNRFGTETEPRGKVIFGEVDPAAEIYLLRFENQSKIIHRGEQRLVPFPYHPERGIMIPSGNETVITYNRGASLDIENVSVRPGSVVGIVQYVAPDSTAHAAGLRTGDFISKFRGWPIDTTVLAADIDTTSKTYQAGVRAFDRVISIAGFPTRSIYDIEGSWANQVKRGNRFEIVFDHDGAEIRIEYLRKEYLEMPREFGFEFVYAPRILETKKTDSRVILDVTSPDGAAKRVKLPPEEIVNISMRLTSNPVFRLTANKFDIKNNGELALPEGSYLICASWPGREMQRFPVLVERASPKHIHIQFEKNVSIDSVSMLRIPAGEFISGGDLQATTPRDPKIVSLGEYWLGRTEVTHAQYLQFINDPVNLKPSQESRAKGSEHHIPRRGIGIPQYTLAGDRYQFPETVEPGEPVRGILYESAIAFCDWLTKKSAERGENFIFTLPTPHEWEKAARGVDGRHFPWGNLLDLGFCNSAISRNLGEPRAICEEVDSFPRDESPFGIVGCTGGASEFVLGDYRSFDYGMACGGSFNRYGRSLFSSASHNGMQRKAGELFDLAAGFRVAAHRAKKGNNNNEREK